MVSKTKTSDDSDDGNIGFGFYANLAPHKPGFDQGAQAQTSGDPSNHRFRPRDQKDIPQGPLADRIAKSKKGK